jgi:hypothetical protein
MGANVISVEGRNNRKMSRAGAKPRLMVRGVATTFYRDHWMTIAFGAAYGWMTAQIDDFFRTADLL